MNIIRLLMLILMFYCTTTVAAHLCHLRSGEILAAASRMNPQVPYGEDLMSRVSYAMMNEDGTERMHAAIVEGLNGLVEEVVAAAGLACPEGLGELSSIYRGNPGAISAGHAAGFRDQAPGLAARGVRAADLRL